MRFASILVAAALALGVQAVFAQDKSEGAELDIEEVISVNSDIYACGLVDAVMVYKNSASERK